MSLIVVTIIIFITAANTETESDCVLHSECHADDVNSGVCYTGRCICHPSFYPPYCKTSAQFNEPHGRKRFEVILFEKKSDGITGEEAALKCRQKQGYLATIQNMEENVYILHKIRNWTKEKEYANYRDLKVFIGLNDKRAAGVWEWVDGTHISGVSYQPWANSQTIGPSQTYAAINGYDKGTWSITPPDARENGYVCQFEGMDRYKVESQVLLTYPQAEEYCRDIGFDVVSFSDLTEYEYTNALYRVSNIGSGWIGLYYRTEPEGLPDWEWSDGIKMNGTALGNGVYNKPEYDIGKRVELQPYSNGYSVVNGNDYKNAFICKTARYKRDCSVLQMLDSGLPSHSGYIIRPKYITYYNVYCDMSTDGGGFTYYITHGDYIQNDNIKPSVYSLQGIRIFCTGDFQPVDVVSPTQVLELERVLLDQGYDLENGVVPIASYVNGRYLTLNSRMDITSIIRSLELDYKTPITKYKNAPDTLGIGYGATLVLYKGRANGLTVLAVICSTNNKQAPPDKFSVSYISYTQQRSISHRVERDTILSEATVCSWINFTDTSQSVVYSLTREGREVLALVLSPYNDHFVINDHQTASNVDFGVHDGRYHSVCLVVRPSQYEVYVDGVVITSDNNTIFGDINLKGITLLGTRAGSFETNYAFLGSIDSLDIWDYAKTDTELRIPPSPLYMPGNVVRWRDFNQATTDIIKPPVIFGYSRFKVGIGPSGISWARRYCVARHAQLGAPRNDYEYTQMLALLQGHRGWIDVSRENNTLISHTTTPHITLTYLPTDGPDGQLIIDEYGDLITAPSDTWIQFVCQFDVTEDIPELQECMSDEMETSKGKFSWVRATVNSTVKVLCPHGVEERQSQGYGSRVCGPSTSTLHGIWSIPNIAICNYANRRTQELEQLRNMLVTSENAAQIATQLLSLTNDSKQLDGDGLSLVTGIIEDLVRIREETTTADITHTLSNVLDVDTDVFTTAQANDKIADRIVHSLESVAGSVTPLNSTKQHSISTKNIVISAIRVAGVADTRLDSGGIGLRVPADTVTGNETAAYLITYRTDKLFTTDSVNTTNSSVQFINTPIISAGVDNMTLRNLTTPVQIVLPVTNKEAGSLLCVYYVAGNDANHTGEWRSEGVQTVYTPRDENVTCLSDHMTSFAVMMTMDPETRPVDSVHDEILSTMTYVCLFVSIVGLILTIFALGFQKSLWRLDMTKIHVYLSISLMIGYIVFLIGVDETKSLPICVTVAVVLHLTFLIAFMWMGVEAYTLYLQFVKVFPSYTPNFIPKCMIVVFALPAAIAGGFLVAGVSTDVTTFYEVERYCWLKSHTLYYGFILPILVIVAMNLVLFAYVTRNICNIVTLNKDGQRISQLSVQIRAALSVLVVLGVTWIIGAFTFGSGSIYFQYAFTLLNGLQGFAIFLFHVLLKPEVRKRWYNSIQGYTTSLSSNSHALKSSSFHRAQKYEVHQLHNRDESSPHHNDDRNDRPLVRDTTRFTYLSNSNDYVAIESRPISVASAVSDTSVPASASTPLIVIKQQTPNSSATTSPVCVVSKKRPALSTVASMEPPGGGSSCSTPDFAFSPITQPDSWEYSPLDQM